MTPDDEKYLADLIAEQQAMLEAMSGPEALHRWFSLSYASFAVLPRVLMQEMPDDWQKQIAKLLTEFDETFPSGFGGSVYVITKDDKGKFRKFPQWLLNYRHPDKAEIEKARQP